MPHSEMNKATKAARFIIPVDSAIEEPAAAPYRLCVFFYGTTVINVGREIGFAFTAE
jgi:hypothetical protein